MGKAFENGSLGSVGAPASPLAARLELLGDEARKVGFVERKHEELIGIIGSGHW
jgi:hypothetical protein